MCPIKGFSERLFCDLESERIALYEAKLYPKALMTDLRTKLTPALGVSEELSILLTQNTTVAFIKNILLNLGKGSWGALSQSVW